jgi:hypothetical protein
MDAGMSVAAAESHFVPLAYTVRERSVQNAPPRAGLSRRILYLVAPFVKGMIATCVKAVGQRML